MKVRKNENKLVVLKFGGTSIQDSPAIERVSGIIKGKLEKNEALVVVVSAMGKVTNKLGELLRSCLSGDKRLTQKAFKELFSYHIKILKASCGKKSFYAKAKEKLSREFFKIEKFLGGNFGKKTLTPRASDYIVSFGEKISSIIINGALQSREIKTKLIEASSFMITDNNYTNANPLRDIVREKLNKTIKPHIGKYEVILTQGFIGKTKNGAPSTIGREGSDFSAAIVAADLGAARLEIWKDVNGVMTADPQIVANAKNIPFISYDDMAHLSYGGAKVIHPKTIAPAKTQKIPVYVLNSYDKGNKGTLIFSAKRKKDAVNAIIAVTGKSDPKLGPEDFIIYIIGRNIVYIGNLRRIIDNIADDGKAQIRDISKSNISLLTKKACAEELIRYLHKELIE